MDRTRIFAIAMLLAGVLASFFIATSGNEVLAQNEIVKTYNSLSPQAKALYYKQSDGLTKEVPERLVELDQKKIGCFGPGNVMKMSTSEGNLGGQCCGALTDFDAYELQMEALHDFIEAHGSNELIPQDPYDVSVELAQELTSYDTDLVLDAEEQATYDGALEMSHHGPCCCKCWKWYMMSGLGKKLIVYHGWNSEDVAALWDLSSSCGHAEDTDLHQHYEVKKEHLH